MLLKYYNHIMNLNSEKTIIKAWNIYCREKDEDNAIDESDDSFKTDLQNVLHLINVFDWQRDSSVRDVDYESFDSILCSNRS